jgi:hypothetical protein
VYLIGPHSERYRGGHIEICERCAGQIKIIVEAPNRRIEDASVAPAKCRTIGVIERILAHLKNKAPSAGNAMLPENRAPPRQARLGDPV